MSTFSKKIDVSGIGSPFSHDVCSCNGESPLHFNWVFDQPSSSGIEVYLDYGIQKALSSKSKYKFLWLCESKTIVPSQYELLKNNFKSLSGIFRKIFVHDEDLLSLDSIFEYVPPAANFTWIKSRKIHKKSKIVSMISSGKGFTEGHRFRNAFMQRQMQLNPWIEFYGREFKPFRIKEEPLIDFMFSITMENESYTNYYTEKLMDCFATGTIPVYHGTPKVGEMFNEDGIIILDESFDPNNLSKDLYHSKINAIEENFYLCLTHEKSDDILYRKIMEDIG
jgi:hypothetical protein